MYSGKQRNLSNIFIKHFLPTALFKTGTQQPLNHTIAGFQSTTPISVKQICADEIDQWLLMAHS